MDNSNSNSNNNSSNNNNSNNSNSNSTSNSNNNSNNISNNNSNNNNSDSNDLFLNKIFRNIIIKNIILDHLKLFNKYKQKKSFNNFKELNQYQFKDYLLEVVIENDSSDSDCVQEFRIPSNISILEFGANYQSRIFPHQIPDTICEIRFKAYYHPLEEGVLPASLKRIYLGYLWNHKFNEKVFPFGVELIHFGHSFNQDIAIGSLPSTLIEIDFGFNWCKYLHAGVLPDSVRVIYFSYQFDQLLLPKQVPANCKQINFKSGLFNNGGHELVIGAFPYGLVKLVFGFGFDQVLQPFVLPSSIEHLEFGYRFNNGAQSLECGSIPKSCTTLKFGHSYTGGSSTLKSGVLPNGLLHVEFGERYSSKFNFDSIPTNVQLIKFNKSFISCGRVSLEGCIPSSVKSIYCQIPDVKNNSFKFDQSTINNCDIYVNGKLFYNLSENGNENGINSQNIDNGNDIGSDDPVRGGGLPFAQIVLVVVALPFLILGSSIKKLFK